MALVEMLVNRSLMVMAPLSPAILLASVLYKRKSFASCVCVCATRNLEMHTHTHKFCILCVCVCISRFLVGCRILVSICAEYVEFDKYELWN